MSVAARVAEEMGVKLGNEVGKHFLLYCCIQLPSLVMCIIADVLRTLWDA